MWSFFILLMLTAFKDCHSQCVEVNCKCCNKDACNTNVTCTAGCPSGYPVCTAVSVRDQSCEIQKCKCCNVSTCPTDGNCNGVCLPGYHGGKCLNKCPDNCITCRDHPNAGGNRPDLNVIGYCTRCKEGYYFKDDRFQCQSTCSSGCKSCTSASQCSACHDGYIPDVQNPGSCFLCPQVCTSCQSFGCVSCTDGYFITTINGFNNCVKCQGRCLTCKSESDCTTCVNGWYGTSCDINCSVGCDTVCIKDDGSCTCKEGFTGRLCENCIRGRYGIHCTEMCSNNCQNSECDRLSGDCNACVGNFKMPKCETCVAGYHGPSCSMSCPLNCKNNTCFKINGTCSVGCQGYFAGERCNECITGKYGTTCQQNCPGNCNKSLCFMDSGFCVSCKQHFKGDICDQCVDGRYSDDCSLNCPKNCTGYLCYQDSGNCFSCALNQTYGHKCNTICPQNCLDGKCKQENGHCSGCKQGFSGNVCDECEVGKYGTNCEHNCSLNCRDITCNWTSGDCHACINMSFKMPKCENCTTGLYGDKCDKNCPANCDGSQCEKNTGTCSKGCSGKFAGDTCEECIIGKFGNGCDKNCPMRCLNNSCMITSGNCIDCISNFTEDTCEECIDGLYRSECNLNCPPNCERNTCEQQTGNCRTECIYGFSGDKCCLNNTFCVKCLSYTECDTCIDGKYGQTCDQNCSINCYSCNKLNGSCDVCKNGFHGPDCINAFAQHKNKEENSVVAPIGGTVGGIAALAFGVVFIFVWYRRRRITGKKEKNSRFETNEKIYENADIPEQHTPAAVQADVPQRLSAVKPKSAHNDKSSIPLNQIKSTESDEGQNDSNYYNTQEILSKKIQVSKFADHVKSKNSGMFIKEFQKLPKGLLKPCLDARKPENLAKNRYNSIYPYDDDRVKLAPPGSDFINACYIDGYRRNKEYIASLGPIMKATEDFKTFWRMVWQEKTELIVMVTNLMEKGGMKCEQYWPDVSTTKSYGDIVVTCQSQEIFAEHALRKLTVFKGNEKRPLHHIHYTAWPDKAAPDDVTSLIDFRQKVKTIKTSSNGRTIVHCSAGVGRTGTYIALDILTQEGETEGTVDVFGRVTRMRYQRTNMVQTWEQYEYLHHALVHTLSFDYRPIAAEEFEEFLATCSDTVMEAKFKRLQSVPENVPESEVKAKQRNSHLKYLNRKDSDIPGDIGRPRLYEGKTELDNDYINAVYMNSYRQKDRYILAMTPLPDTVPDFLTLLVQEQVTCVVSLDDEHTEQQGTGVYTPADNQPLKIGVFEITSRKITSNSCFVQRSLSITMNIRSGQKSQTFHHFQINNWKKGENVPRDEAKFLQLIREVKNAADDGVDKGKLVVHCLNAAERSGLFCAISILLQKMDTDHEVSVVNTLRQVRVRRSLAIPNKEQYIFCHKCICTHLQSESSNLYTNLAMR